jgi:hypothetical protein
MDYACLVCKFIYMKPLNMSSCRLKERVCSACWIKIKVDYLHNKSVQRTT